MYLPDNIESELMMDEEIINYGFKTLTIRNAGEAKTTSGDKEYAQFNVKSDTGVKFAIMLYKDSKSRINLIRGWGAETQDWIGKVASVEINSWTDNAGEERSNIILHATREECEIEPVKEFKGDPNIKEEDIPVIGGKADNVKTDDNKGEVNVEDIPF